MPCIFFLLFRISYFSSCLFLLNSTVVSFSSEYVDSVHFDYHRSILLPFCHFGIDNTDPLPSISRARLFLPFPTMRLDSIRINSPQSYAVSCLCDAKLGFPSVRKIYLSSGVRYCTFADIMFCFGYNLAVLLEDFSEAFPRYSLKTISFLATLK